jgi:uncharacterized repeat protein (TIGR03847 family)
MNRRVFSFDSPDSFVCGAVGQPGQRTFYLQAAKGSRVVSVALEKAQVAVLAERLATLLLALRQGGVDISEGAADAPAPTLAEPVVEQFRVGTLTIGWDGDRERIVIEARELTEDGDELDEEDEDEEHIELAAEEAPALLAEAPALLADSDEGPDLVRVELEPDAALAFASGAVAVVQAGRPPCPNCGAPLEPTGHFCPRRNGYQN